MVINWYGKNCFKLQAGNLVVLTDPFEKENNLSPFRGRTDIIIRTSAPLSTNGKTSGEAFEISYPGEYEIKNVSVKGWSLPDGKNLRSVYLLETDDLKIVLLGHLNDAEEIKKIQEYLEDADIVFIPAGGKPYLSEEAAAKLIRQLKPGLVIPTLFDNAKDLKSFFKELGKTEVEPQEKLTISKKELSKEKLLIGCLKV